MNRTALKRRMHDSALLQHAYVLARSGLSRAASLTGRRYEAARQILSAWKHVPTERLGDRRMARARRLIREACFDGERLRPIAENQLRLDLVRSRLGRSIRARYGAFPLAHRVRMRFPRPPEDPERQGDLMILKAPDADTGEKGVLLVMFHETALYVAATYDLAALSRDYTIVLETSNWGAQDARFLPYIGCDADVHIFAPRAEDHAWFEDLRTNLVPVRIGSGEWVDPAVFRADMPVPRSHDVVMVAAWDPLKRHELLFGALAEIRRVHGRRLRVALIGYEMGWTQSDVEARARAHDVMDDIDWFEMIPQRDVAHLIAGAGVSVLLSLQEGANRSVYESMFCDTPVLVSREHRGINLDHVNEQTGLLADDDSLASVLLQVLDRPEAFAPRAWAEAHIGHRATVRRLNEHLRDHALRNGRPWSRDLLGKVNAPSQRYAEPGAGTAFDAAYAALAAHLLPCASEEGA